MDARITGIASLFFISAWASPSEIKKVDFRNLYYGSIIATEKSSPPYAALEDARANFREDNDHLAQSENGPIETLITGPNNIISQQKTMPLQLSGQVISVQAKRDHVAELITEHQQRSKTLNSGHQVLHKTMGSNIETIESSYVEIADKLVRSELQRRAGSVDSTRTLSTSGGGTITISKPNVKPSPQWSGYVAVNLPATVPADVPAVGAPVNRSSSPERGSYRENPKQRLPTPPINEPGQKRDDSKDLASRTPGSVENSNPMAAAFAPTSKPTRFQLRGSITFKDGAALLGSRDEIAAQQIIDGLEAAKGTVNIRDAAFVIDVDSLEGILKARVLGPDGHVRASGSVNLYELAKTNGSRAKINNISIIVKPVIDGAIAEVVSATSYGKSNVAITDARLFVADINREIIRNKLSGQFEDTSLVTPSSFILLGKKDRFWPSMTIAASGEDTKVRLFPDGLMKALFELSHDKYVAREAAQKGVIWGRVAYNGQPIEGARVELIGDPDVVPTYFTGFLPDRRKYHTSNNGEFAFTNLKGGEQLVQVVLGNKRYWPVMMPIENRMVTYADLVVNSTRTIQVESYDAFAQQSLAAALKPLGAQEEFYIDDGGKIKIDVNTVRGRTYIEADAGDTYAMSRVELNSEQTELYIPHVKLDWLKSLRKEENLNKEMPETATVGFVNGDDFDVFIGDEQGHSGKVVYFNGKGNEISGKGLAGGGFVIFDLEPGLHTLTIIPNRSKKVITQLVYVDDRGTHISRINIPY